MDWGSRLEAAGFGHVNSQNPRFLLVHRGNCLSLIEVATGQVGASMIMTPRGPATLQRREGGEFLVGHGFEDPASPEQLEELRLFAIDLAATLA